MKRKLDFHNGKVVRTTNLWAYSFEMLLNQFIMLFNISNTLFKKLLEYASNEKLQERKTGVLTNVVNHLNKNLEEELGVKITQPATTGGIDVWVYLANKLDLETENKLENYFSGVLSKYTTEFGLDIMIIEQNSGAGWVAKFDVKENYKATYNRMARQSNVENEEDF